jgi:hypothetical protein
MTVTNGLHANSTGANVHTPITFIYADETARLAATGFAAGDVGKFAWQQDDNTFYVLTDDSPATWAQVGAGSGTGGDLALIEHQDKDAGAGAAFTFDVSGTTFRHLLLQWGLKGTDGSQQNAGLQFNADAGAHYDWKFWYSAGTSSNTGQTMGLMGSALASGAAAGLITVGETRILHYRNTHWHKNYISVQQDPNNNTINNWGGRWADTSAITEVKLLLAAGNIAQYCYADLYGYG